MFLTYTRFIDSCSIVYNYSPILIQYSGPQALIADLELMFNNARHYNEESSQVYQDANFLEKLMKDKCKELHIPIHGM